MVQDADSGHHPGIAPLDTCTVTVLVAGVDCAGLFILAMKCFVLEVTHTTFAYLGMAVESSSVPRRRGKPDVGVT